MPDENYISILRGDLANLYGMVKNHSNKLDLATWQVGLLKKVESLLYPSCGQFLDRPRLACNKRNGHDGPHAFEWSNDS